ncbi:DUF262 domain-containing protein [Nocardia sp. NPDC006044]|uniref:DUF262 domain-containing protein n=1 Tax=Nocardia sp. NPDC006044 TaxID=3364306 RepID=UPI0036C26BBB
MTTGEHSIPMDDTSDAPGARSAADVQRELDASGDVLDIEREDLGEPIDQPYDPERIDVITRNPTISLMLSRIRRQTVDLQPDFQRLAGIWNDVNQSRLIESMLLRIPLPAFYAAETADESWAIVDGIQRLTAITRFMEPEASEFPQLKLKGLNYLPFNNYCFDDLPGRLQTRLEETEIVLHLIREGTPDEAKFNIFARLNTGGLPLTTQELRHALIPGQARELLTELADSELFQRATAGTVSRSRMADREMVLRFLAFILFEPDHYQNKDFDNFLRDAMRKINTLSSPRLEELRGRFYSAMDAAHEIFGENAFRKKYKAKAARYPINKALFEAVTVSLARRSPKQLENLTLKRDLVNKGYINLMNSDSYFDRAISVSTGDPAKVRYRFRAIDSLFAEYDGS